MRGMLKAIRAFVVVVLILAIAAPACLYVLLSLPWFQQRVASAAQSQLSSLLGTQVSIGKINISPFNRVTINDVAISDDFGKTALKVHELGAGLDLWDLVWQGKIVVTYAEVIGLDASLYKATPQSPLNIQNIIDRLSRKEPNKPPTQYDLAINMALIRRGRVTYNVLSAPPKSDGRFDANHLTVENIKADVFLPRLSNGFTDIDLASLSAREASGLELTNINGRMRVERDYVRVYGLEVALPNSIIRFSDVEVPLKSDWKQAPFDVSLLAGSYVTPSDLAALMPGLSSWTTPVTMELGLKGVANEFVVRPLEVTALDGKAWVRCNSATVEELLSKNPIVTVKRLSAGAQGNDLVSIISLFTSLKPQISQTAEKVGKVDVMGDGRIDLAQTTAQWEGSVTTRAGNLDIDATCLWGEKVEISGHVESKRLDPNSLLTQTLDLGIGGVDINGSLTLNHGKITGEASAQLSQLTYKGKTLSEISADAKIEKDLATAHVVVTDPNANVEMHAISELSPSHPITQLQATIHSLDLGFAGVKGKLGQQNLSVMIDATANGRDLDEATGSLLLHNITLSKIDQDEIKLGDLNLEVSQEDVTRTISLSSQLINGAASGAFALSQLPKIVKGMLAQALPSLISAPASLSTTRDAHLAWHFTLANDTILTPLVALPFSIIESASITGSIDQRVNAASLHISAPYLRQKNKLIENTVITAQLDQGKAKVDFGTEMPSKFGPMRLNVNTWAKNDTAKLSLGWKIDNKARYDGSLNLSAFFSRDTEGSLDIDGLVTPSLIVINDTVWNVSPATLTARHDYVEVDKFEISREGQFIKIDGRASADTTDVINLKLRDIDLDYVFETLNIPNVAFGGRATGNFGAARLFSKDPLLSTTGDGLKVENISYNHCVMGNAVIQSAWHNQQKAVSIDAEITQPWNGGSSSIHGVIRPMAEELDFKFRADKSPVGFMKPFMAAFTSDVKGEVSGQAHLYGTFALLDMTGAVYAQNLAMKLDFTNTVYTATDSVFMTPGYIKFDNVALHDRYGQTASVSGYVTHKCFKEPTFKFNITKADNLLVYDVKRNNDVPWYGRIFGTGGATVVGRPGVVDIKVAMTTSRGVKDAGTDFTFMLSDAETAEDYDFITFRDRNQHIKDSIAALDTTPLLVKLLRNNKKHQEQGPPTEYKMDFNVNVTPEAQINLIMDPVGGDVIKAFGNGHLRMTYTSDGELEMFGDYVLERGSYLFTLQDIIKKQFTIRAGSSISFDGDPYAARLDITGQYDARANLTDLDESFAQDRDLNSTTVNVQALLKVTGDMRSPDITFDLDFPLLTSDIKRKVRSIVSTDDMMNRQIIYLLAMNRFFTPEYMNATKGNELVSMASSTISSQLATMLGQLSNKWTIAPQFRSDRGDFSDMEVDLALSSHLLNNRLLLNGNFGYRDKSLNNNSFIGDFDIQYLLNRSGSISLKAYNRYNDQSYYLKSALTTQGVGVVFRRDFDNIFSFLKPFRKKKKEVIKPDTAIVADTLLIFK